MELLPLSQRDGNGEPVPKRRRLSVKTSRDAPQARVYVNLPPPQAEEVPAPAVAPQGDAPVLALVAIGDEAEEAPDGPAAAEVAEEGEGEDGVRFPSRQMWNKFHKRLSRWKRSRPDFGEAGGANEALAQPLRNLCLADRKRLVDMWAEDDTLAPEYLRSFFVEYYARALAVSKGQLWRGRSVLLTYNGTWGNFTAEEFGIHPGAFPSVSSMCECLREHPRIHALRKEVVEKLQEWAPRFLFHDAAFSLELSVNTFEEAAGRRKDMTSVLGMKVFLPTGEDAPPPEPGAGQGVPIRVHLHIFLRNTEKFRVTSWSDLSFRGSVPVPSQHQQRRANSKKTGNMGLYYLQCPKVGMLCWGGTAAPYEDYLVDGTWAMNLLQQGKMSLQDCRAEIVRCGKNLPRLLENMEKLQLEQTNASMQKEITRVQNVLASRRRPFWKVPAVTEWLNTFRETRCRYPFLVLEGPSMRGKTQFAKALAPSEDMVLEVDCAGKTHPDLRLLRPDKHRFVLFDELAPNVVIEHKKLFQAGPSYVTLGSSVTNMYSFSVWSHALRLIVCSNKWTMELDNMTAVDADWIRANSVYVYCHSNLYQ